MCLSFTFEPAKRLLSTGAQTRWSEEYQADVYRNQFKMLDKIPFLRGTTPWILMDFRSPRRELHGIQDFWNRKGLIDVQGDKKEAFYMLRDWYKRKESNK